MSTILQPARTDVVVPETPADARTIETHPAWLRLKAAATAEERGWKMWEEKAGWYLEQLKAKGMKVQAPSPALAAGFKKAGETLTADWLKKAGADGQAIVDAYKKM